MMTIKFVLDFQKLAWKKLKLHCKDYYLDKKSNKGWQEWKKFCMLQACLPKCWKLQWRQGLFLESSYSKKHWSIGMLSPFAMDENKLFIYLLECQYFRLGLLFKPLQIFTFLLWSFVSWIKMLAIGCCQMHFILPSPYALPWKLM
jgi:hypothetical protein